MWHFFLRSEEGRSFRALKNNSKDKHFFIHVYMHKYCILRWLCLVWSVFLGLHSPNWNEQLSLLSFCPALAIQQMPLFFPLWLNMLDGWQTLMKGHKCATCKTTMISLIAGTFWPACSKDLCLEENLWAHLYLPPLKGMAAPGQLAFILTPRDFKGGKRLRNAPQTKYLSVLHPSVVIFFTTALPSFMAPLWQFFENSMGPHQLVAAPLRFTKLSIAVDLLKNVPPVESKKTRYTSGVLLRHMLPSFL